MGRASGHPGFSAALRLNILPRARRAVARTRAGLPRQRSGPRRNWIRRPSLRANISRGSGHHFSSTYRRNPSGLPRGGPEVCESLAPPAERERRGKEARARRRPSSTQARAKPVSARRKFRVRSGKCGPIRAHQQDLWRQRYCCDITGMAAIDSATKHSARKPGRSQALLKLLIK